MHSAHAAVDKKYATHNIHKMTLGGIKNFINTAMMECYCCGDVDGVW